MSKPSRRRRAPKPAATPVHAARLLSAALGSVPSMIWGGLYLLLIPLFAALYTLLPPNSFYHSTIVHDQTYKRDQLDFEQDVERWAAETTTARLIDAIERVEHRRPEKLRYFAGYGPEDFWPRLLVSADFGDPEWVSFYFALGGMTYYEIHKDLAYSPPRITSTSSEGFDLMARCEDEEGEEVADSACPSRRVEAALKPGRYFAAPPSLKDRVFQLRTQAQGFNTAADMHGFGRMLYLSAVTITTVGYGDIVPLTDASRIAVACEAIAGVVLIGLFLNAVAHEHQRTRPSPEDAGSERSTQRGSR